MNKSMIAAAVMLFTASAVFAQTGKSTMDANNMKAKRTMATAEPQKNTMAQQRLGMEQVKKADAEVAAAAASLSTKGVQTTTTDVYDVNTNNKKGTLNYGSVEERTSGPLGKDSAGMAYASYSPSKAAMSNEKKGEWSLAVGQTYSFNEDTFGDRYATNGMAAGANVLWDMTPHFAWGFDYMYLNPNAKSRVVEGEEVNYRRMRAHDISFMGRYTINAWDSWRVYVPMGAGLMNARLKTDSPLGSTSKDKWGASLFAGLGLQYDITTDWFVGLEYRYIYSFISDKHLSDFGRDSNLQFHNAFLRVGMRF